MFDVQQFIDRQPFRPFHVGIMVAGVMLMFVDGFDIFMIGKIAPAIARGFGREPAAMTSLILLQQIGLSIGAFATTPFADRIGRKRMLLVASFAFGVLTLAGAFAPTLAALGILRGLAGLFLAGVVPMVLALVTEFMPRARRAAFVSVALVGYSLGNGAGGIVAAWLLGRYGWQSGFWVGGVAALACVPVLLFAVPETLQFRALRNPADPAIARTLRRIDPHVQLAAGTRFVLPAQMDVRGGVRQLWGEGERGMTALFWAVSFLSMGGITLLAAWLPSFFLQMAHVPIERFAVTALLGFSGGIVGILTIGTLMDRMAPVRLLVLFYAGLAIAILLMGLVPFGSPLFLPVVTLWSFCQGGGQAGLNMFIARAYPILLRSTGLGWAGGAGRIAGIVVPLVGAWALALRLPLAPTLALCALPAAGAALLLMVFAGRLIDPTNPAAAGAPARA